MKRLPVLLTFVLGITAVTGTAPAAAAEDAGGTTTIPLGWEAEGPASGQFNIPLFDGISVIPGDSGQRTVAVLNDGPADGMLTASIVNVEFGGNPSNAFYDDLLLNGKPVSDYQHRKTAVLKTTLERGASTNLDLFYRMPAASTGGNSSGAPVAVSFDVLLQIREIPGSGGADDRPTPGGQPGPGESPDSPVEDGTPAPEGHEPDGTPAPEGDTSLLPLTMGAFEPIDPDSDGTPSGSDDDGGWWAAEDGPLAETGANVMGIAGAGLLLLLAGLLLLRRRRREAGNGTS